MREAQSPGGEGIKTGTPVFCLPVFISREESFPFCLKHPISILLSSWVFVSQVSVFSLFSSHLLEMHIIVLGLDPDSRYNQCTELGRSPERQ